MSPIAPWSLLALYQSIHSLTAISSCWRVRPGPWSLTRSALSGRVGGRREVLLAPLHAPDPNAGHETRHRAARNPVAFPVELLVDPPRPVDLIVGLPHPPDLDLGRLIADIPGRRRPGPGGVVRPLREPDHPTYRSDRPAVPVGVDEPDVHRWRGSTSCAKKLVAALRISIVRCWSATSLRSFLISA